MGGCSGACRPPKETNRQGSPPPASPTQVFLHLKGFDQADAYTIAPTNQTLVPKQRKKKKPHLLLDISCRKADGLCSSLLASSGVASQTATFSGRERHPCSSLGSAVSPSLGTIQRCPTPQARASQHGDLSCFHRPAASTSLHAGRGRPRRREASAERGCRHILF